MDPQKPESYNHKTVKLSTGRTYHFVDQLPRGYNPKFNLTLLCVHGFPDFWYGWRYQIGPWVGKGFRVVAIDSLGHGGTDKPQDSSEYSTKKLSADLAALLDYLDIQRAVLVGHDWGAYTVGRFALWYPDRMIALVMLNVPYTPPSRRYFPIEAVAERAPNLGYQVYLADKASTPEVESDLPRFLRLIFQPADKIYNFTPAGALRKFMEIPESEEAKKQPLIVNDQEFQYYLTQVKQGMTGPLNYYRTHKVRHEEELAAGLPASLPSDLPVMFLWGTLDYTITKFTIERARKFIPNLQNVPLEGVGHFSLLEAKDKVTEIIGSWLEGVTPKPDPQARL